MASEEQDKYEALVDSVSDSNKTPASNDGSLELENSTNSDSSPPVTKGDPPPEISNAELDEAHKKFGRQILFGDEIGDTGTLHRITESRKLHYSQENVVLYGGEGNDAPRPRPNNESVCCTVQ